MDSEHWQRVDRLFQAAIEVDPSERRAFLNDRCCGDDRLQREVESLLDYDQRGLSLIDAPAFDMVANLLGTHAPELSVGQQIGHYKILNLLGAGGMGDVYLAHDSSLGRNIALKLLPADFTIDDERVRRFQQEARAASALNHPNIITIYEIGQFDNRRFMATEFIEGTTLRQLTKGSDLRLIQALDIASQIASALSAAHQAGIVHRDIKPENIMLRPDGYVKVLDFGLAKLTEQQLATVDFGDRSGEEDTLPGVVLGTAKYMSPEQARGQRVDGRSDIFSLGVVLYEVLTGRPPFEGETTSDLIAAILKAEPPPLREQSPAVPDELQHIISKALSKDQKDRYQSVDDMLADLKALKQELELHSKIQRAIYPDTGGGKNLTTSGTRVEVQTADEKEFSTGGTGTLRTQSSAESIVNQFRLPKARAAFISLMALTVVAAIGYGLYRLLRFGGTSHFQSAQINRLTTSGKINGGGAISPDGRYVAYLEIDGGQQNLMLRQVATSSNVLVASGKAIAEQVTFSPDGNYLYYVGKTKDDSEPSLYKMPSIGGVSQKVVTRVNSFAAVSPDGQQLAFVRFDTNPQEDAVIVVNADGSGERKLASRKLPQSYESTAWSPDGKRLACTGGGRDEQGFYGDLVEIDLRGGDPKPLTNRRWQIINAAVWLSDGNSLLMTAEGQIWQIFYPGGDVRRITTDLNDYSGLSLTRDSSTLVSTQIFSFWNLYIQQGVDATSTAQLTFGSSRGDGWSGLSWTPDGKIIYSSSASGHSDIWLMEPDGSNQRQLTVDLGSSLFGMSVSPDGRYIVFVSTRAGPPQIWRVDIDGSNPRQLTSGGQGHNPFISPDSKWVYYLTGAGGPASKVSIDGGESVEMPSPFSDIVPRGFSPDGKLFAYMPPEDRAQRKKNLGIASSESGQLIKIIELPRNAYPRKMQWTTDGKSITYIDSRGGADNLWMQSLDGGSPIQLTNFKEYRIHCFAWSGDGKYLVFNRGFQTGDLVLINSVE